MSTKEVVELIGSGVAEDRAAELVPSQPIGNLSFMIATNYLDDWKDVLSDDLGIWGPSGTKTHYFTRTFYSDGKMKISGVDKSEEANLMVKRYLHADPTEKSFKRLVVKVDSKTFVSSETDLELMPHIFIQYYFESGVKDIVLPPHGNAMNTLFFI